MQLWGGCKFKSRLGVNVDSSCLYGCDDDVIVKSFTTVQTLMFLEEYYIQFWAPLCKMEPIGAGSEESNEDDQRTGSQSI